MPFSPDVKEGCLFACGRCCCICHKFCGIKIEVHHIREESKGGGNTLENAIPLCFDCHADMRSYDHHHPKGNKYSVNELQRHRDAWYKKVAGNIGIANREEIVESDKTVYRLLVSVLPWEGSINFIRTNNFAGFGFPRSQLDDLFEFEHECHNPAFVFMDPDLEGLRALLMYHIDEFTRTIAAETSTTNNLEWSSVPKEWELNDPKRFYEVVTKLHGTAQEIVGTYDSLVRTATRKLGVLPEKMGRTHSAFPPITRDVISAQ